MIYVDTRYLTFDNLEALSVNDLFEYYLNR